MAMIPESTAFLAMAARRLYKARRDRAEAKKKLRAYREEHGGCDGPNHNEPSCYHGRYPDDPTEWCAVCRGAQPLWCAYRHAATQCGVELRSLMALGKKYEEEKASAQ